MRRRVRDFAEVAKGSAEEFIEQFNHPFLVLVGVGGEVEFDGEEYFTTRIAKFDIKKLNAIAEGKSLDPESIVFSVVKRQDMNPYAGMITIGRASNCDIVIPLPGVSKFHSYLKQLSGDVGKFVLGDGGSRNGTKLNDNFVTTTKRAEVDNGDYIMLGAAATLRYFTCRGFWQILAHRP